MGSSEGGSKDEILIFILEAQTPGRENSLENVHPSVV